MLARLRTVVTYPFRSTWQFFGNIRSALGEFQLEQFVPPWIWERFWSTLGWFRSQVPRAIGYQSTPTEQMTASIVIGVAMIVVSIGVLTPLSAIMLIPLAIGFARLHPAVERLWPLTNTGGTY